MMVNRIHSTEDGDNLIAELARVSSPENEKNTATAPRLISYLIRNQHWSPFQMVSACVEIITTRDIGRQILRHQSAIGFQEFSGRYAAYGELERVRECRFQDKTNRQSSHTLDDLFANRMQSPQLQADFAEAEDTVNWWNAAVITVADNCEKIYTEALKRNVAKETARAILPEGLVPTRMYFHGSLRTWLHYIGERTKPGVQKEHRQIAFACRAELEPFFLQTFKAWDLAHPTGE